MEMRLLENEAERAAFERGLTQARARRGSGFGEKRRSRLGAYIWRLRISTEFLTKPATSRTGYWRASPRRSLRPEDYPKPDLTHLPPEEVFEVGELWALSLGAGSRRAPWLRRALGLAGATTLLIYRIVSPWDLTKGYPDYRPVDAPIAWPFAETLDGRKVLVQAMVLDGDNLQRQISAAMTTPYRPQCQPWLRSENPLTAALLERRMNRLERVARNRRPARRRRYAILQWSRNSL